MILFVFIFICKMLADSLFACALLAVIVWIALASILIGNLPFLHVKVDLERSSSETLEVRLIDACFELKNETNRGRSGCLSLYDFNKNHVKLMNISNTGPSESYETIPMAQCDAQYAPIVKGAVFINDTLFGAVHLRYMCFDGYRHMAMYDHEVFCTCNDSLCQWTNPLPECRPVDKCIQPGESDVDICTLGNRTFIYKLGVSLNNPSLDFNFDNFTIDAIRNEFYVLPSMIVRCSGYLHHIDIIVVKPGFISLDIWRPNRNRQLTRIKTIKKYFSQIGITAFALDRSSNEAPMVFAGDMLGFHFETNENRAEIAMKRRSLETPESSMNKFQKGLESFHVIDLVEMALEGHIGDPVKIPSKPRVLHGLYGTSIISGTIAVVLIGLTLKSLKGITRDQVYSYDSDVSIQLYSKVTRFITLSMFFAIFTSGCCFNNFFLYYSNYNCNAIGTWDVGIAGWIVLLSAIVSGVLFGLLCYSERRLATEFTNPEFFRQQRLEQLADVFLKEKEEKTKCTALAKNLQTTTRWNSVRRATLASINQMKDEVFSSTIRNRNPSGRRVSIDIQRAYMENLAQRKRLSGATVNEL